MPTNSELAETDNELLMQFARRRSENAFRQLVERHASLVMGVCRQVSRNEQDAEDAFQATLLILARRAHRLLHVTSLGGWLHRVAYRTSLRTVQQARRQTNRIAVESAMDDAKDPLAEIHVREMQRVLHEELQLLPDRYRSAIVLCDLQGMTRAQAADCLDSTESAVKAALARGRRQLRMRLLRRGFALSVALTVARDLFASVSVPITLIDLTVEVCAADGAGQETSNHLELLTHQGAIVMLFSTMSRTIAVLMLATLVCVLPFLVFARTPMDVHLSTAVDSATSTEISTESRETEVSALLEVAAAIPQTESPDSSSRRAASSEHASGNGILYSMDGGTFVLLAVRDTNAFLTYNKSDGRWERHIFPEGLKVVPNVGSDAMGFGVDGARVTELVGIDQNGKFRIHKLPQPLEKKFNPSVTSGLVYYLVDGIIYAFSGQTGTWDTLEAPHVKELPAVNGPHTNPLTTAIAGTLIVDFGDHVAVFGRESGKWSSEKLEDLQKQ
jgi:RNA polymerase sigma factor (sigma-70 family)